MQREAKQPIPCHVVIQAEASDSSDTAASGRRASGEKEEAC